MPDSDKSLARLVELEEERAKREKSKAFSEACSAFGWLLFLGLAIYFFWPLIRLWLFS